MQLRSPHPNPKALQFGTLHQLAPQESVVLPVASETFNNQARVEERFGMPFATQIGSLLLGKEGNPTSQRALVHLIVTHMVGSRFLSLVPNRMRNNEGPRMTSHSGAVLSLGSLCAPDAEGHNTPNCLGLEGLDDIAETHVTVQPNLEVDGRIKNLLITNQIPEDQGHFTVVRYGRPIIPEADDPSAQLRPGDLKFT